MYSINLCYSNNYFIRKIKNDLEQFYQNHKVDNNSNQEEQTNNKNVEEKNEIVSVTKEQATEKVDDINEEQLKAMCESVNKGLEKAQ